MNKKQKIIFITMSLLAVVFLSLSAFLSITKQRERQRRIETEVKLQRTEQKRQALQKELEALQTIKSELESKLSEVEERVSTLNNSLQELEGERDSLSRMFEESKGKIEELIAKLEEKRVEISDLKESFSEANQERNLLKDKVNRLQIAKEVLEKKVMELLSKEEVALGKIVVRPETAPKAREGEGQILVINKEFDFVVINLGKRDGVSKDDLFSIYSSGKFSGTAQVNKVYEGMSVANLLADSKKEKIKEFDVVVKESPSSSPTKE